MRDGTALFVIVFFYAITCGMCIPNMDRTWVSYGKVLWWNVVIWAALFAINFLVS